METFLTDIDSALFLFCNVTISNAFFDIFFLFITSRNNWILPLFILAAITIYRQKRFGLVAILLTIVAVGSADPFSGVFLKGLFGRFRPCNPAYFVDGVHQFLDGAHFLIGKKGSYSFPSSHAMNVFTAAIILSVFYPKQRLWFFIIASLIGFSRIYVGVHYPSDVLGGAILGVIWGLGVYLLYQRINKKLRFLDT